MGKSDHDHITGLLANPTPLEQLAALPVNFSSTGWGTMQIVNCCQTTPKLPLYMRYVMHSSCEAESWVDSSEPRGPVCMMNSGYVSAWLSASFGLELVTVEVSCKGAGDSKCEFVVSIPSEIKKYARTYCSKERMRNLPTLEIHQAKQSAQKEGVSLFNWYSKPQK